MVAPNASTFDLTPPTRPGTQTFNGLAKEDDSEDPPNPQTMPNAAEWNTMGWLLLALGRVMPVAIVSVTGATATVSAFGAAPKNVVTGSFSMAHPATGVIEMTWAANTFPPAIAQPTASLNSGPGMIWIEPMTNGVRIHTYDAAGAAADLNFTATIY